LGLRIPSRLSIQGPPRKYFFRRRNPGLRSTRSSLAPGYVRRGASQQAKAPLQVSVYLWQAWAAAPLRGSSISHPLGGGSGLPGPLALGDSLWRLCPNFGVLPAHFVSWVAAGYVNSGQRDYRGRGNSFLIARNGVRPARLAPGSCVWGEQKSRWLRSTGAFWGLWADGRWLPFKKILGGRL
jgi:hypothetical protein